MSTLSACVASTGDHPLGVEPEVGSDLLGDIGGRATGPYPATLLSVDLTLPAGRVMVTCVSGPILPPATGLLARSGAARKPPPPEGCPIPEDTSLEPVASVAVAGLLSVVVPVSCDTLQLTEESSVLAMARKFGDTADNPCRGIKKPVGYISYFSAVVVPSPLFGLAQAKV